MYSLKFLACFAVVATASGSAQVINENTLVPIGFITGGVVVACTITWKVATIFTNQKRDNEDLRKRLEALEKQ